MQCQTLLTIVVFIGTMAKVFSLGEKDRRAGGIQPASVSDKDIQNAAVFATAELDKARNSMFALKVVHVVKATKQIVSGTNFGLTVVVGETNCRKNQEKDLSSCPLQSGEKGLLECHFVVWSRPWLKDEKSRMLLTDSGCVPAHQPQSSDYHQEFDAFIQRYGRQYDNTTTEYEYRYSVFVKNMQKVELLNKYEQSTAVYGATKFADMTEEEFRRYLSGPMKASGITKHATIPKGEPPQEFDWRTKGAVTAVKNQEACGSCWAFSVTGNIEGQWQIKKGELVSLSEQQLVDCDKVDDGCNGGEMSDAYNALIKMGGCEPEATYPYRGRDEQCKFEMSNVKVYINGSVNISKSEDDMASWLAANGPISIGINAAVMQFYFGGISHPWKFFCEPAYLDHGVLIVGYGVKDKEPFWIVKNSWGADWGVNGYYLVYRGDGVCGLNLDCTSAVVD